ncbi:acyltransferase family protein [Yoonia vestfoldensis]|uniref:acyltransferase family protein n=1 Tax=Yoonia vestfoldensis TaxID=245188 RepID=UPI000378814D|nr:acyltransferase [Yoonia vestfoldensis]
MMRATGWLAASFAQRPGDNPWLDLLRTVAITLVLLRHGQRVILRDVDPATYGVFDFLGLNGWVGVDLFFVLSGYLLTAKLLAPHRDAGVRLYLQDRARRILPAYLAVLTLTVAGVFPGFAVDGEDLTWRVIYHLLFLQDVLASDINVVFWSLGVEVKYYLALPLLVWLLLRLRRLAARIMVLAVLLAAGVALRTGLYMQMDQPVDYPTFWVALRSPFYASLDALLIGSGVALLTTAGKQLAPPTALSVLVGVLLVSLVWLGSDDFMGTITLWDSSLQPVAIAVLCGTAVWASASLHSVPLPAKTLFRIGARLSYSLYLVHFPLIPLALALSGADSGLLFWAAFLGLSLGLSVLIYLGIERPFLARRGGAAHGADHAVR